MSTLLTNSPKQAVDSNDVNSLISRNPCARCAATKKPRCVCPAAGGGADICPDELAAVLSELGFTDAESATAIREGANGEQSCADDCDLAAEESNASGAPLTPAANDDYQLALDERQLTPDLLLLLQDLLRRDVVAIHNEVECGVLAFQLRYNPTQTMTDRLTFQLLMAAVLKEFELFKLENNLSTPTATPEVDQDGFVTTLRLSFPKLKVYDAFIQRLLSKRLLPGQPEVNQQDRLSPLNDALADFLTRLNTPLATRLTRGTASSRLVDEEEALRNGTHLRPRSWLDGLKPKGFK